jgi:hypothetical protein
MGQQTRFNRKWTSRNFVEGGTDVIDLPIGMDIESLMLSLNGSIVVGTAYATCKTEGMAKLIKKIDLLLDGKTIATMNGEFLTHGNFARAGGLVRSNPAVAIGSNWGEIGGYLDLAHIGGVRPKDSILRTIGKRQFQLFIQWGTFADMYTGAGAVTSHSLKIGVTVRETKEHGPSPEPEILRQYKFIEKAYPSSQEDRIPLDPNVLYRGIMLRTESAGDLSSSVLTRVKVQIGSEIVFDVPRSEIIDMNKQDNSFSLQSGYYFIDFAPSPNGQVKFSDFLDLYGHADAFLILEVSGGKVQIQAHEFEWDKAAIAANQGRRG